MLMLFFCICSQDYKTSAIFKKIDSGLELVFCTPGLTKKIPALLKDLVSKGVYVRAEHFAEGQIDVDREKIEVEDPRYLAGCAEEFSARGWKTFIYPQEKAEIFRKFFELAVPANLRATFIHQLNLLNKNATQELEDILNQAVARASNK
ncbi:MAG: hypothetical protein KBC69_00740 [Candidatus Magasanikbacteria bacterium]|nr:hypothetical protein [Candidatus Magasanikbacteria bacterium]